MCSSMWVLVLPLSCSIHPHKKKNVLHVTLNNLHQQILGPIKLIWTPILSPLTFRCPWFRNRQPFFICKVHMYLEMEVAEDQYVHPSLYLDVGRVSAVARVWESVPSQAWWMNWALIYTGDLIVCTHTHTVLKKHDPCWNKKGEPVFNVKLLVKGKA